jgi:hypothetical protein
VCGDSASALSSLRRFGLAFGFDELGNADEIISQCTIFWHLTCNTQRAGGFQSRRETDPAMRPRNTPNFDRG